jgi:hypothetical protein
MIPPFAKFAQPGKIVSDMYRSTSNNQLGFTDFNQPAGYQLDPENEWVKRADLIPWDTLEDRYASLFPSQHGNVAVPFRMALGTLIIQKHYDLTDRAVMSYITANPYPEYFIGLPGYTDAAPFLPSALVKFRKRFSASYLAEVNDAICARTGRSDTLQVKVLVSGIPYAAASFRQVLRERPVQYRCLSESGALPARFCAVPERFLLQKTPHRRPLPHRSGRHPENRSCRTCRHAGSVHPDCQPVRNPPRSFRLRPDLSGS